MSKIKHRLARKAVKSTAKHTVHGTASKLKRDRFRTATLLGVGALTGACATWLATRAGGHGGPSVGAA